VTWADIESIRKRRNGKLIFKGILDPDDARRAVDVGEDAIVVSNHGGRQLDGAVSTTQALPAVVDAASRRIEVWPDGDVRTGQDVRKAVALGARGTVVGRASLYGPPAGGEQGVRRSLEIIAAELDTTMAICRDTDITSVGPEILAAHHSPRL
jgi:L-lactate dehydrogenase (cytochrome)